MVVNLINFFFYIQTKFCAIKLLVPHFIIPPLFFLKKSKIKCHDGGKILDTHNSINKSIAGHSQQCFTLLTTCIDRFIFEAVFLFLSLYTPSYLVFCGPISVINKTTPSSVS